MKLKYIKIGAIIIYISLAIGLEAVYRNPLFTKSLTWEKQFQDGYPNLLKFFKFVTIFGTASILIPLCIIVFLFFSLNKAYQFLAVVILCNVYDNFMKLIYANPRPYWVDSNLFDGACDGGYGNPSGHSFSSSGVYLSLWHLITDFDWFKKTTFGKIIKILLFIFTILFIISIILSRVYLGVHAVNQILFGISMGFSVYYIYFFIIEYHTFTGKEFFDSFQKKSFIILYIIIYIAEILLGVLLYYLVKVDNTQWDKTQQLVCPDLEPYRKYNNDAFVVILNIFALMGAHYGIHFLHYLITPTYENKLDEVNNWNQTSWINFLYCFLLCILFVSPIILSFVVSGKSSLSIIFFIKVIVPYFSSTFLIFGLFIFTIIRLKICNELILSVDTKLEIV